MSKIEYSTAEALAHLRARMCVCVRECYSYVKVLQRRTRTSTHTPRAPLMSKVLQRSMSKVLQRRTRTSGRVCVCVCACVCYSYVTHTAAHAHLRAKQTTDTCAAPAYVCVCVCVTHTLLILRRTRTSGRNGPPAPALLLRGLRQAGMRTVVCAKYESSMLLSRYAASIPQTTYADVC
jgi:hypothetical protein